MASYNLAEGAQMWYIQVQTDEGTPSWSHFKELLHLRYGPPLRAAPLAECRRTGTIVEYQDRFQALLPRAGPFTEAQRVQLFTGGLQPSLNINVRIQNPQSLAAAKSLARQFELREQYTAPASRAPPRLYCQLQPPAWLCPHRRVPKRPPPRPSPSRAAPSNALPRQNKKSAAASGSVTIATTNSPGAITVCASDCSFSRVLRKKTGWPRRPPRTCGLRTRSCSPSKP
jgi:hypothetical protein